MATIWEEAKFNIRCKVFSLKLTSENCQDKFKLCLEDVSILQFIKGVGVVKCDNITLVGLQFVMARA